MSRQTLPGEPTLIFETVHGSRAFGLAVAGSDTDLKGVVVGPPSWYLGYVDAPEQLELGKDHVRYELRKLIRLAAAGNPMVIEMLWAPSEHHRALSPEGERLLAARELFLSRRVAGTFGGYALGQLKRIKSHRRWLLRPPTEEPTRAAFGLPERSAISKEQRGAAEAMLADGRLTQADLDTNFLAILDRERRYRAAHREFAQYRHWLRSRNPARAALERKFGYDTKHAQHLIRLLRMGLEIIVDAKVIVARPDREELLAIRAGRWSYDELVEQAETLYARLEAARERSPLPAAVDEAAANRLCVDLVGAALGALGTTRRSPEVPLDGRA